MFTSPVARPTNHPTIRKRITKTGLARRNARSDPPPQVKLGCGRAESHQQNPRFKTHDLKILKDTYKPGGVTPLPPPTPRIPLGRPLWTGNTPPFSLQKSWPPLREGSLGPHWPLPKIQRGSLGPPWPQTLTFLPPWDASESTQRENRNHQNTLGFIVFICNGTYLGRSRGTPWRQKKPGPLVPGAPRDPKARRHTSQGAPRDLQDAKTIVFDLIIDAPGALL